jgi:C_GCAxxG_C_C family probable redox protein
MGRRGEVCGAVTSGIMALGLKYGRGAQQDRSVVEQAYQKTQELMAAFERVHGSCTCRILLSGCDLRTPEGQRFFKENDLFHKTCARCVQTVSEILAGMLAAPTAQGPALSK